VSLVVSDAVTQVLATAMDGVSLRQQVTADNIANVDTPNYRATSVDFETSLRQAVDDGSVERGELDGVQVQTSPTDTPVGANGNNVDLRHETLAAVQSQYQYQLLSRAMSDRFTTIHDAIGNQ
jgi:flagellar basal-body rod protein FlgB